MKLELVKFDDEEGQAVFWHRCRIHCLYIEMCHIHGINSSKIYQLPKGENMQSLALVFSICRLNSVAE